MKFVIVGIEKGDYGNGATPLTIDNLFRIDQDIPEIPQETDPTVPLHVKNITEQDIQNFLKDTDTTYEVFTNNTNGLVPAPNRSEGGSTVLSITSPSEGAEFSEDDEITIETTVTTQGETTYSLSITEPLEGIEFQEGDDISITTSVTETVSSSEEERFLNEYGQWKGLQIQDWIEGFNNNIISGSVTGDNNKIITLTKRDGTTLSIPFIDNSGTVTGDDVINTLSFDDSNGVLTAVTSEGVQITTNLDGRYALINHTHPEYADKIITDISFSGTTTKTATITLADGSIITGSFTDIVGETGTGDGNDYLSSGTFNTSTGVITLTRTDGGTVTIDLDDRYSLIGHTHSWSDITGKPTFDNYDGWNLKTNGIQRIKVASGGTADFVAGTNMSISYGAGGQVIFDASGGAAITEGTIIVTSSRTLAASDNQKTLICRNSSSDIVLTIPSGLGTDFTCNIVSEDSGSRFVEIVAGSGVTLKKPHGGKVLTDYTANIIKRTGQEIFNLQGELTP